MTRKTPAGYRKTCATVAQELTVLAGKPCSPDTVRRSVNLGLIDCYRDSAGRRLLPDDAAQQLHLHRLLHGSFTITRRKPGGTVRSAG